MAKEATRVRRRERKNITSGVAHVNSSFNNTMITITDAQGNTISWSSAGLMGFKGSRKSTPYAAQMAAEDAGRKAGEHGVKTLEVEVSGPGSGREVGAARAAVRRLHDHVDPRRDADRAQRLPAAQAPPRLIRAASGLRFTFLAARVPRRCLPPEAATRLKGKARDHPEKLARADQAEQARNLAGQRSQALRDGGRRAARARLRPDARQCAAPRASLLAAGRRRQGRPDRRRAARVLVDRRRPRGRHRHRPQHQGNRHQDAGRGAEAHGRAQAGPRRRQGRRHPDRLGHRDPQSRPRPLHARRGRRDPHGVHRRHRQGLRRRPTAIVPRMRRSA